METKFTKGKWILNESRSEIRSENAVPGSGGIDIIAQCYCGFNYKSTLEECNANAKLIAAAPDLLEALMLMADYYIHDKAIDDEDYIDMENKVINAIEKATK